MEERTIFSFIKENIDAEGFFSGACLPDDPFPTVPRIMGAEDAFFRLENLPADVDKAFAVLQQLNSVLENSSPKVRADIYKTLCRVSVASISEQLVQVLSASPEHEQLLTYARSLFYGAAHREPFKFSLLLFGVHGMDRIYSEEKQLWEDIVSVARCEEFTYFFFFACGLKDFYAEQDFWNLAKLTKGWGKIAAMEMLRCEDEEQRLWLLANFLDVDEGVEYLHLATKVFFETDAVEFLCRESIDSELYLHLSALVQSIAAILTGMIHSDVEEAEALDEIDCYGVLRELLRHARIFGTAPEKIFRIVGIAESLKLMIEENNYSVLTANQAQELVAACDAVIYARDWRDDVLQRLITDDGIDEGLCYFSAAMGYDIWEKVFKYWCGKPRDMVALRYLLTVDDDGRVQSVIDAVDANISLYADTQMELASLLQCLRKQPGRGNSIIIAGLTSMYDWPRGIACSVLEDWGVDFVTPALRRALLQGLRLSSNRVVTERINALLNGENFNIEKLLRVQNF